MGNTILREAEICFRRTADRFNIAQSDSEKQSSKRLFSRTLGYGPRDGNDDVEGQGMKTYRLGSTKLNIEHSTMPVSRA